MTKKYFSYCHADYFDSAYERHNTADEAARAVADFIDRLRDEIDPADGWPEDITAEWGEIHGFTIEVETGRGFFDGEEDVPYVDYIPRLIDAPDIEEQLRAANLWEAFIEEKGGEQEAACLLADHLRWFGMQASAHYVLSGSLGPWNKTKRGSNFWGNAVQALIKQKIEQRLADQESGT